MTPVAEFPELEWTRETLLALADRLDAEQKNIASRDSAETVRSAANALRFMAALTVQDECRRQAPYKPLFRIRTSDGEIIWTCGHSPPHESSV